MNSLEKACGLFVQSSHGIALILAINQVLVVGSQIYKLKKANKNIITD